MAEHALNCPKLPWMIDFYSTENGAVPISQLKASTAKNRLSYLSNLDFRSKPVLKRLTALICTVEQKYSSIEDMEVLIENGMSIARIKSKNFNAETLLPIISNIKTASENYSKKLGTMYQVAIGMDLSGPELRTGSLQKGLTQEIELIPGNETIVTSDPSYEEKVTKDMIYVDYQNLTESIEPGDKLVLDNNVRLSALEVVGSFIRCLIETAGKIGDHVNVSIESSSLNLPPTRELETKFAVEQKLDFLIIPVKTPNCVKEVKTLLGPKGRFIQLIASIENSIAVKNIEAIIEEADIILISRTELLKEVEDEKLFLVQKMIIATCNKAGKPVICAPLNLDPVTYNLQSKKTELLDVANIILDGADGLLLTHGLSVQPLKILDKLCKEADSSLHYKEIFESLSEEIRTPMEPIYSLAISVVEASLKTSAAAIILLTVSGRTAQVISRYRPRCPIIALTRYGRVARKLRLFRGVEPVHFVSKPLKDWDRDVKRRLQFGITYAKYSGLIKQADVIITLSGIRPGTGFTNSMSMHYVSHFDVLKYEDEQTFNGK